MCWPGNPILGNRVEVKSSEESSNWWSTNYHLLTGVGRPSSSLSLLTTYQALVGREQTWQIDPLVTRGSICHAVVKKIDLWRGSPYSANIPGEANFLLVFLIDQSLECLLGLQILATWTWTAPIAESFSSNMSLTFSFLHPWLINCSESQRMLLLWGSLRRLLGITRTSAYSCQLLFALNSVMRPLLFQGLFYNVKIEISHSNIYSGWYVMSITWWQCENYIIY